MPLVDDPEPTIGFVTDRRIETEWKLVVVSVDGDGSIEADARHDDLVRSGYVRASDLADVTVELAALRAAAARLANAVYNILGMYQDQLTPVHSSQLNEIRKQMDEALKR